MTDRNGWFADDFADRARKRIKRMERVAQEITDELGISREAKYDVLSVIEGRESHTQQGDDWLDAERVKQRLPKEARPYMSNHPIFTGTSKVRKQLSVLVAALVMALLVSSLIFVLYQAGESRTASLNKLAQAHLYIASNNGIYRLDENGSGLRQQWFYKLNAPQTTKAMESIGAPGSDNAMGNSRIDTPVTVADGDVYFGGNEEDAANHLHYYLYVLRAQDGSLRWKYKIGGNSTGIPGPYMGNGSVNLGSGKVMNTPLIWRDLVLINVISSPDNSIIALQRSDGIVRWTYKYRSAFDPIDGIGAVANNLVYVTAGNALFALNAVDGSEKWSVQIPRQISVGPGDVGWQSFQAPQFNSGVIYTAYIIANDGARIYTFNPVNGRQIWHSQKIDCAFISWNCFTGPPIIAHGTVYFSVENGYIYALRANDGKQLWKYNSNGFIATPLQEMQGVVYVKETPAQNNAMPQIAQGHILALDATHGTLLWGYGLPAAEFWRTGDGAFLAENSVIYVVTRQGMIDILRASDGLLLQVDHVGNDDAYGITLHLMVAP